MTNTENTKEIPELGRTFAALQASQNEVTRAVLTARAEGSSWASIGKVLGISKQAAQQKYGQHVHNWTAENGDPSPEMLAVEANLTVEDLAGPSVTPSIFLEADVPANTPLIPWGIEDFHKAEKERKAKTAKSSTSTHGGFRREYVLPGEPITTAQSGTGKGPQFCPKCGSNNHKGNDWHTVAVMDGCRPTKYDPQDITDFMNGQTK